MRRRYHLLILIGLMVFTGCRDKELDMTVKQKSLFDQETFYDIAISDAWNVTLVQWDDRQHVELEYSAFLEDYLDVWCDGTKLGVGLNRNLNLPSNTVMNAVIYVYSVQTLSLEDASTVQIEGDFPSRGMHLLTLEDASTLKGGFFIDGLDLRMKDASTCVDLTFDGGNGRLVLEDASVFKGNFYVRDTLTILASDASRLTTYGDWARYAEVAVSGSGSLNMLETTVNEMLVDISDASEASVNVTDSLKGKLSDASTLNYKGTPVLDIDSDETSTIHPL